MTDDDIPPIHNRWLTQDQLASQLRKSRRTLERMRNAGTGPRFSKVGKTVLYRECDVEEWLLERSFGSTAEAKSNAR
jgi:predicted DNA-binding transcriptional regulator AlpA